MHFERLKITGFKSFADPVDVTIPVGLTGVIGPNGCGKSNLVEAMRWVMGESSSKAMRAGDMDDVIFAGSGNRASRSFAEVVITLGNEDRSAPAIFNHDPVLEISRKLVRESGSTYRVNGREARARDVQLLFADAATGARSPSMVRQGQISELIMAKPSARRRILEDAAGISGLAARRHEAELRLNAAEANLEKLQLTLQGLEQQQNALQKQAREAGKYRKLTQEIQSLEVRIAYRQLEEADAAAQQVNAQLAQAQGAFAQAEAQEVEANTAVSIAAQTSIHMREKLETASHQLQELKAAQKLLAVEIERLAERSAGVDGQRARIDEDMTREQARLQEALQQLAALEKEQADLQAQLPMDTIAVQMAKENLTQAEDARHKAEQAKLAAANALMQAKTQRDMAAQLLAEAQANCRTFEARHAQAVQEFEVLQAQGDAVDDVVKLKAAQAELQGRLETIQAEISKLEAQFQAAQTSVLNAREETAKTQQQHKSLLMEQASLQLLLKPAQTGQFESINAIVQVDAGFETATAAALQDELAASLDAKAPAFLQGAQPQNHDAVLPKGAISLAAHVHGADVLMRRLSQIGVVESLEQYTPEQLHAGQKLVTRAGQILRWDGLRISGTKAEAQAHYFTQKNRLIEVEVVIPNALAELQKAEAILAQAQADFAACERTLKSSRTQLAELQTQLNAAEAALRIAEQQQSAVQIALANKSAQIEQLKNTLSDAQAQLAAREAAIAQIDLPDDLAQALQAASEAFNIAQYAAQTARSAHEQALRESDTRAYRAQQLGKDLITAQKRRDEAEWAIQRLQERLKHLDEEQARLAVTSVDGMQKRQSQLIQEIATAQANLQTAQANFTSAEIDVKAREQAVKSIAAHTLAAREIVVRLEVQAEAAGQALNAARMNVNSLLETHHMTPEQMELQVGSAAQKSASDLAEQLERTKRDRERLGAVNLIAENELNEIAAKFEALNADQADLTAAIAQFRGAIASLNTEGRARLNKAFDAVNAHFVRLFTTLFEGGEAELIRTNAEDPLETGLEIIARPPGKKPQTLSLLSGGEQALTAMALIFAVFLSNPSPICVLDEVDAPLDDANVERFCKLLDEMKRQTNTRFMIITHNPITMAHMDQLYGVTMAERGVSQVVSVQLREAVELAAVA